jgi:hypothetical protein
MTDDAAGHLLHNILNPPSRPGPPYTHTIDLSPPDPAEAVAWLRKQIKDDKVAAEAATPGPWAWEATGEKDSSWAVGLVQDEYGNTLSAQIEPGEGIIIDGVCEGIDGNLADAAHITLHNPADVIADCEAKLAILDACQPDAAMDAALEDGDISTGEYVSTEATGAHILRLLAAGFRRRDGYSRYWGDPVTHTITEDGQ